MTITYTAFDGKIFDNQEDCENYEDKLKLLGGTYDILHKVLDRLHGCKTTLWICEEKLEIEPHCGQELPGPGNILSTISKEDLNTLFVIEGLLEKYKMKQ